MSDSEAPIVSSIVIGQELRFNTFWIRLKRCAWRLWRQTGMRFNTFGIRLRRCAWRLCSRTKTRFYTLEF